MIFNRGEEAINFSRFFHLLPQKGEQENAMTSRIAGLSGCLGVGRRGNRRVLWLRSDDKGHGQGINQRRTSSIQKGIAYEDLKIW